MLPSAALPGWAVAVGTFMPTKYLVDALGGTLTCVASFGATMVGLGVLAGCAAIFFAASTRLIRRT